MHNTNYITQWNTEKILDDIEDKGFSIIDNAYPNDYIRTVRNECLANLEHFRAAAIQNGIVSTVRSDHILWVDHHFTYAQQHINTLQCLSERLNQSFYFGIREIEAHFACYNDGEFYAKHRDNPQQKNNRVISSVLYLHSEWQSDWGGELHLQDKNNEWHIINPMSNRLAIFQSDLLHEVLVAKQQRLSITAWLRHLS